MNLEKSKSRITKKVKMGFQGYPQLSIAYFGATTDVAEQVVVSFLLEEGAETMQEQFNCKTDAREDQGVQSAIVKMIERSGAKTVNQAESVERLK